MLFLLKIGKDLKKKLITFLIYLENFLTKRINDIHKQKIKIKIY